MKTFQVQLGRWLVLFSSVEALSIACAQNITQTILLQPGWNSVWLEVLPIDKSPAVVFSNLPVASVWTRAERLSSVDFIQNPSEAAFNNPAWQRWFPPSRPEALLNSLFAVFPNRAYLINLTNAAPVTWAITGRPSFRILDWVPDSYNLRGLQVDPASPTTFLNYFRHSRAHYDVASGQLQNIYRLNGAGEWARVAPDDLARPGEACWIYTRGATDYLAPLTVRVESGDGLDFGLELTELTLRIGNVTDSLLSATVKEFDFGEASRIAYYQFNPAAGSQWAGLPAQLMVSPPSRGEVTLRFAVKRQDFADTNYASILEVRDGAGTRLLIPVNAQARSSTLSAGALRNAAKNFAGPEEESRSRAGLWVGSATLNAVSEPHSAAPANPTPTKSLLSLTLIIHVDDAGHARLLKEVTQMWQNGTYTNDATGASIVATPGRYVLLTDNSLIPFFTGSAVRDGESVGRRISTIGYDFPASSSNNFLALGGYFAVGEKLTATWMLPFDHPTNPFKHKYHPDHDNLNARFDAPAEESFATTREIEIEPSATSSNGPSVPDYGYNVIGGAYREKITGIHKQAIYVGGTFRLSRVSPIARLNPNPTP